MKLKIFTAFILGALMVQTGWAQNGWEKVQLIARGSFVATTAISVGTGANVALFAANPKRADLTCRNNSAFTLYIGTNTTGTTMTGVGFPVLTNETFALGAMSDGLFGLGSGGTVDVRCFEGAIR